MSATYSPKTRKCKNIDKISQLTSLQHTVTAAVLVGSKTSKLVQTTPNLCHYGPCCTTLPSNEQVQKHCTTPLVEGKCQPSLNPALEELPRKREGGQSTGGLVTGRFKGKNLLGMARRQGRIQSSKVAVSEKHLKYRISVTGG